MSIFLGYSHYTLHFCRSSTVDCGLISYDYLNLVKLYLSANSILSLSGRDLIYPFQPGHQVACHLHNQPKNDFGLLSYFARKPQFSQSGSSMLISAGKNSVVKKCITII